LNDSFVTIYDRLEGSKVIDQELPSNVLPVLYENDHKWKAKLEELLQPNQVMMLPSPGDAKRNILSYPDNNSNIQILEMPTKYIKERRDLA